MITLNVNGRPRKLDVPDHIPLLWTLHDVLKMNGTKLGCGIGLCGACTLHIDGQPARSCITSASAAAGSQITTLKRLAKRRQAAGYSAPRTSTRRMAGNICRRGDCCSRQRCLGFRREDRVTARRPLRNQRYGHHRRLVRHEALCAACTPLTLAGLHGIENENVAPGPSFGSAHSRPLCRLMIDLLTNNPIPMPPLLVV